MIDRIKEEEPEFKLFVPGDLVQTRKHLPARRLVTIQYSTGMIRNFLTIAENEIMMFFEYNIEYQYNKGEKEIFYKYKLKFLYKGEMVEISIYSDNPINTFFKKYLFLKDK